jgi:membrane-associated protease RseP (regulator of RpoE activity)
MNKDRKRLLIQLALFVVTLLATTVSGAEWMYSKYVFWVDEAYQMEWSDFVGGFQFSIPFLLILSFHEFGHYFTARYHKIGVTLPYYIPLWLGFLPGFPSFGTMGAMIRITDRIYSLKHYFDVGVSGPLAGFVIAIGVIWYGFANLPEPEYIYQVHPEYEQYGLDYADHVYNDEEGAAFKFGPNITFWLFETYVADAERIPHPNEIIHYPLLLAGYLALFFTALNLLPVGQLDGGHIIFGLFGPKRHKIISRVLFTIFLFYSGLGLIKVTDLQDVSLSSSFQFLLWILLYLYFLYATARSIFEDKQDRLTYAAIILASQFLVNLFFQVEGYTGWLLFAFIVGRFLGVDHPPVVHKQPLSTGRVILGWIALIVLVLCFSPEPFILEIQGISE